MIIKIHKISFVIVVSLIFSFEVSTQDLSPEFLASLPEDVQAVFPSVTDHRLGLNAGDSGYALKHVPVSL